MNIDDLRDKIKENIETLWNKIQDNSYYITLHERFENLSSRKQNLILFSAGFLCILLIALIPYSYFSASSDNIDDFKVSRHLIEQLVQVSSQNEIPTGIPSGINPMQLQSMVQNITTTEGLIPEQIKPIIPLTPDKFSKIVPPSIKQEGIIVNLEKLNLRQIVRLAYQFSKINPTVKLYGIGISPNPQAPQYSNVTYSLLSLTPPTSEIAPTVADDDSTKPAAKTNKVNDKNRNKKDKVKPKPRSKKDAVTNESDL